MDNESIVRNMNLEYFKKRFEKVSVDIIQKRLIRTPLVSVCVQTYQHAGFIRQCLDGILTQQTNFEFEILLGEDASTDGTREICIEYAQKHPDKIRLFLHKRENNIAIGGAPTGRFNFVYNLFSANGKYVALCEGDDYWIDPLKLQKQVDFLEANPVFSISCHQAKVLEKNNQMTPDNYIYGRIYVKSESNIYDLTASGNYIRTPTVVFRNILRDLPVQISQAPLGDFFLYVILAQYGKISWLTDEMAVYRNSVGIHSTKEPLKKRLAWQETINVLIETVEDDTLKKILRLRIGDDWESERSVRLWDINKLAKNISFIRLLRVLLFKIRLKILSFLGRK